jgi:hypothetical protein
MKTSQEPQNPVAAADLPQPAPTLTPEAAVEQLRATRAQLGEVTPLTPKQRKTLRNLARTSNPVLQASINVIGAFDNVSQAVGQPAETVRQMYDEANRWTAVEDELRLMLNGVAGANLIRRQRITLLAAQACGVGSQLARDPANAVLVPHLQEVKRLKKSLKRSKKAAQAPGSPQTPAPGTPATPAAPEPAPQGSGTSGKQQV